MLRSAVLAVLAATCLGACAGGARTGSEIPASTAVRAYVEALRGDDPRAAYDLLATELQRELPYDDFLEAWKASAAEREAQAMTLDEGLRGQPEIGGDAVVGYADEKKVALVHEDGRWRLRSALVSRNHASRPHDAVAMFVSALEARSFDDVMRVLTVRRRDGLRSQLDGFVGSLSEHVESDDDEIYFVGDDRAELEWRAGEVVYKLVLRREQDEWRVDDVHLLPVEAADEADDAGEGEGEGEGDGAADAPAP